jgi:hypothetical protein
MVQAADPRKSDHLPELPRLDLARDRRVAVEAHVRSVLVVVAGVPADQVEDMTLTEHDHVIEQLSTKGAYLQWQDRGADARTWRVRTLERPLPELSFQRLSRLDRG